MFLQDKTGLGDSGILSSPDRDQENLDAMVELQGLLRRSHSCGDLMFHLLQVLLDMFLI